MDKSSDPIQELVTAARRKQILEAAAQVFAEKGFHRATIKDIARAARIADGTIYNYFENKEALILGLLDRLNESEQRGADFERAIQGSLRDWARAYFSQRIAAVQPQNLEILRVLISEILVNEDLRERYFQRIVRPTNELAETFFRQWQSEGALKPVDPKLAVRIVAGAFFGLIVMHLVGDTELENRWNELPDILTEIMLNGLMPEGKP
jgi:AcrR family transcriptional regulator